MGIQRVIESIWYWCRMVAQITMFYSCTWKFLHPETIGICNHLWSSWCL